MDCKRGREELGDFIQARDNGSLGQDCDRGDDQKWSDPGCIWGRKAAGSFHERGTQH